MKARSLVILPEGSIQRGLTPPRLDLTNVKAELSKENKLCKPTEPYDDSLTHNENGAVLSYDSSYYSPEHEATVIRCESYENVWVHGDPKGEVVERILIIADDKGVVYRLEVRNGIWGNITILYESNVVILEKFDPLNPPVTTYQCSLMEKMLGVKIDRKSLPRVTLRLSELNDEQIEILQKVVGYVMGSIIPSEGIVSKRPQLQSPF